MVLRGFLMGAADIVPGVSGGTIALVVGIYERLVRSIRAASSALGNLLKGDVAGFRRWLATVEWAFLASLVIGILLAVAALASLITSLLEDHPEQMAGLFMGLIAGSVVIAWRLVSSWTGRRILVAAGVAAAAFILLGIRHGATEEAVAPASHPALLVFFVAGAVAICAMILPGISGSFLLVLLGMYGPVLDAVDQRDMLILVVFVAGTVTGLAVFSQFLHWSLLHHHDTVMAGLIGLMAGSARVVWPWPNGLESTVIGAPGSDFPITSGLAVLAFAAVLGLGWLANRTHAG